MVFTTDMLVLRKITEEKRPQGRNALHLHLHVNLLCSPSQSGAVTCVYLRNEHLTPSTQLPQPRRIARRLYPRRLNILQVVEFSRTGTALIFARDIRQAQTSLSRPQTVHWRIRLFIGRLATDGSGCVLYNHSTRYNTFSFVQHLRIYVRCILYNEFNTGHRRSQDIAWGALFLHQKSDDLVLVINLYLTWSYTS